MNKHLLVNFSILTPLLLVLTACVGQGQTLDQTPINPFPTQVKQTNFAGYEQGEINRLIYNQFESIYEITSVMNRDEILMAITATTFEQFNERDIEKQVKDEINKINPDLKATVSSDQKFFIEIDRLKNEIRDNNLSQADYDVSFKKVKKIVKP